MDTLCAHLDKTDLTGPQPWNTLWHWAEANLSLEGQEQLVSLLLEPHGDLVDDLAATMAADETTPTRINGAMTLSEFRALVDDVYAFAQKIDWSSCAAQENVWYTSEEKLEPRLGDRYAEPVEPYELPLCPGRDAARMHADLATSSAGTVARFLMDHPEHRHIARRAQIAARFPYAEIRDNTIGAGLLPIDLLRAKLAFFGACHFDPRSDRWVRINMFQHAPFPADLAAGEADDWTFPPAQEAAE
jgi:hypothetical protein